MSYHGNGNWHPWQCPPNQYWSAWHPSFGQPHQAHHSYFPANNPPLPGAPSFSENDQFSAAYNSERAGGYYGPSTFYGNPHSFRNDTQNNGNSKNHPSKPQHFTKRSSSLDSETLKGRDRSSSDSRSSSRDGERKKGKDQSSSHSRPSSRDGQRNIGKDQSSSHSRPSSRDGQRNTGKDQSSSHSRSSSRDGERKKGKEENVINTSNFRGGNKGNKVWMNDGKAAKISISSINSKESNRIITQDSNQPDSNHSKEPCDRGNTNPNGNPAQQGSQTGGSGLPPKKQLNSRPPGFEFQKANGKKKGLLRTPEGLGKKPLFSSVVRSGLFDENHVEPSTSVPSGNRGIYGHQGRGASHCGNLPGRPPPRAKSNWVQYRSNAYRNEIERDESNEINDWLESSKSKLSNNDKDTNSTSNDPLPGSEEARSNAIKEAADRLKQALKQKKNVNLNNLLTNGNDLKCDGQSQNKVKSCPKNLANLELDASDMRAIGRANTEKTNYMMDENSDDDIVELELPPPPVCPVIDIDVSPLKNCSRTIGEEQNMVLQSDVRKTTSSSSSTSSTNSSTSSSSSTISNSSSSSTSSDRVASIIHHQNGEELSDRNSTATAVTSADSEQSCQDSDGGICDKEINLSSCYSDRERVSTPQPPNFQDFLNEEMSTRAELPTQDIQHHIGDQQSRHANLNILVSERKSIRSCNDSSKSDDSRMKNNVPTSPLVQGRKGASSLSACDSSSPRSSRCSPGKPRTPISPPSKPRGSHDSRQKEIINGLQKISQSKLRDLINNPRSGKLDFAMRQLMKEHRSVLSKKSRDVAEKRIPVEFLNPKPVDLPPDDSALLADFAIDWSSLPGELISTLGDLFQDFSSDVEGANISISHESTAPGKTTTDLPVTPEFLDSNNVSTLGEKNEPTSQARIRVRQFAKENRFSLDNERTSNPCSDVSLCTDSSVLIQSQVEGRKTIDFSSKDSDGSMRTDSPIECPSVSSNLEEQDQQENESIIAPSNLEEPNESIASVNCEEEGNCSYERNSTLEPNLQSCVSSDAEHSAPKTFVLPIESQEISSNKDIFDASEKNKTPTGASIDSNISNACKGQNPEKTGSSCSKKKSPTIQKEKKYRSIKPKEKKLVHLEERSWFQHSKQKNNLSNCSELHNNISGSQDINLSNPTKSANNVSTHSESSINVSDISKSQEDVTNLTKSQNNVLNQSKSSNNISNISESCTNVSNSSNLSKNANDENSTGNMKNNDTSSESTLVTDDLSNKVSVEKEAMSMLPVLMMTVPANGLSNIPCDMTASEIQSRIAEIDIQLQQLVQERFLLSQALKTAPSSQNTDRPASIPNQSLPELTPSLEGNDVGVETIKNTSEKKSEGKSSKRKRSDTDDDQHSEEGDTINSVEELNAQGKSVPISQEASVNRSSVKKCFVQLEPLNFEKQGCLSKKPEATALEQDGCTSNPRKKTKYSHLFKGSNNIRINRKFHDMEGNILDMKVSDRTLYCASQNGLVYVLNFEKGDPRLLKTYGQRGKTSITCIEIVNESVSGQTFEYLCTGDSNGAVKLYRIKKKMDPKPITNQNIPGTIHCMTCNWGVVYIGTRAGSVFPFHLRQGKLGEPIAIGGTPVLSIKSCMEGPRKVLVVASRHQPISIRDAESGLLLRTLGKCEWTPYSVCLYKSFVLCGNNSDHVSVFDFQSGELKFKLKAGVGVIDMKIRDDCLFCGCYNGMIYVFDLKERKLLFTMTGSGKMVLCLGIVKLSDIRKNRSNILCSSKDSPMQFISLPEPFQSIRQD